MGEPVPPHERLARLCAAGQEHLLAFWDQLDTAARESLVAQIDRIDFDLLRRLGGEGQAPEAWADLARRAQAPTAIRLADRQAAQVAEARARGLEALSRGELGVILVAGGQGSRLGFDHPKGMFPIGPVSGAPLFQILLEKILARGRAAGKPIPLYLMTSPATHDETVAYLAEHKNFGLASADVHIFCQGTMPAVDAQTGRVLLADRGSIAASPDGHGGMLAALAASGGLAHARSRGVRHLFYLQVDNPLVLVCDPEFLGYHLLARSELSSQVVAKRSLRDKVGNVVALDGRLRILEYSDLNPLPDDVLDRRMPDGGPVFWAGSIAVHAFDLDFLEPHGRLGLRAAVPPGSQGGDVRRSANGAARRAGQAERDEIRAIHFRFASGRVAGDRGRGGLAAVVCPGQERPGRG